MEKKKVRKTKHASIHQVMTEQQNQMLTGKGASESTWPFACDGVRVRMLARGCCGAIVDLGELEHQLGRGGCPTTASLL